MLTMKATITSLLLAVVVALSEAKVGALRHVSTGKCPTITNKQDLEVAPYLGRWYEIERFEARFEEGMDCVHVDYTDLGEGVVEVHNMARTAEGEFYDIIGTATVLEPGVLLVVFNDGIPAEYHVLDTDYTNFTAVYNCEQLGELRYQFAWILARHTTLDQSIYEHARKVFENNGIDVSLFNPIHQGEDCPYSP
ncbi:apolipoprotein D-like isoform X2 [Portunus trituberculatus]|uniref:apolipoprotein D-like isoform X2 n=1 Tax=Portunus trituberculatus TaxID=210409 RepID=UPI001E1CC4C6|nr:apolipoprotein D-like isoform X2 [Portunus trituberculatus]